jgi:hypothetical protein
MAISPPKTQAMWWNCIRRAKFRGADFAPIMFQLKTVTHDRIKDAKGLNSNRRRVSPQRSR